MRTYKLGDRLSRKEAETLGVDVGSSSHLWGEPKRDGRYVRAVRTGEFRAPRKGERYLSGSDPVAYMAPNDLSTEFRIMRLVVVEKRTVVVESVEVMP